MIADGYRASFERVYRQNGMAELFAARIYSEDVGVAKPDARMFEAALEAVGLTRADFRRMIMVGNNLSRDIKGANRMGMISVHLAWTPRYPRVPQDPEEVPRHTIYEPAELVPLVLRLEAEM
jgi:putative hydrolase of the HAD superfamily